MPTAAADTATRHLAQLAAANPEWRPWLDLVAVTIAVGRDPIWDQLTLDLDPARPSDRPLLTGASATLPPGLADDWLRSLLTEAGQSQETSAAGFAATAISTRLEALTLIEAAANQDAAPFQELAAADGPDAAALVAIAPLIAMPLLQGCGRRLAALTPDSRLQGACPICGAWATLAESRGLERSRWLRCARCGAGWSVPSLWCPFCGESDHAKLAALVPAADADTRKAETCATCHGYVKSVTTLRPWPPDEVTLADLATVELDLAALDRGFTRPAEPAHPLRLRLTEATRAAAGLPHP